ncbi:MAG: peptidoglycan recognition family protein [Candidatus Pacebacteria bacterium]|nr:peptidoglycan recognition family protein [Candidatus Paceibacterota bacterium]
MDIFNQTEWQKKIAEPHWYFEAPKMIKQLRALHDSARDKYEIEKERIYDFFERELAAGKIALGSAGQDFDKERKPIDTIIIHHTSMEPGLTPERLSGIELLRLYAPQYAGNGPTYDAHKNILNKPIYSGHFRDGMQVFWPYHWIILTDGTVERLLNDDEIGWQAGKWEVNKRSVGIVFDNDYEDSKPSQAELEAVAKLIKEKYSQVAKDRIIGHCEVNLKTACPSKIFFSKDSHKGWKDDLIGLIG